MRIKDLKKFKRAMLSIIFILILSIIFLSNKTMSHEEVKTKTIYISNGDTLWSIAKQEQANNKLYENKEIREIIYNIKNVNNLENCSLYIGQEIVIPYK